MADSRKPIISGNWKMHHNHFEAIQCVQKLHYRLESDDFASVEVTVHPPFTDIRSIQTLIESDKMKIGLGAQNCHWEEKGAFTGEIAPAMLAKLDVGHVIVGHSERRELFGETDDSVNKKVKAVIANSMVPILCCGETLEERQQSMAEAKVQGQVREGLAGLSGEMVSKLVIAYEPIWAIGTGMIPTLAQIGEVHDFIRARLERRFGAGVGRGARILYGGSVKPDNAAEIFRVPNVDGALVGGASLKAADFSPIIKALEESA